MEVTYGLLSSLVQTKSIERILAPIASQISLLIILESEDDVAAPNDMSPCAEAVMKAAEKLITVAKEKSQTSQDQDYQKRMMSACEILDLASSNLYVMSQRLCAESDKEARSRLVKAAKDVLQGTMKVLLVSDDTEVRRIVSAAHIVTDAVSKLGSIQNMPELLTNFKNFTDSAAMLCTLANKRQKDLCQERQREKVITSMTLLKKSIPSMSVALQTFVKYPQNPQAQVSKSYVLNQVLSAVKDIVDALENKFTEEDYLDVEEPGFFVTKIDQILDTLSEEGRAEFHVDMETWTESTVRHSMLVAHLCTDHFRDIIIKTCQRILQIKSRVFHLYLNIKSNPELEQMKIDYDDACETMTDEFCELEKNVNLALLHLVVDVFKETNEPLERLVKAATHTREGQSLEDYSDGYVEEFESHADKICQTASLAAASSTDAKRVRIIRTCVCHLERLDPDIVPAAVTMAKSSCDKMSVKHLKLLMREWSFEMSNLIQVLDEMIEPTIFMDVSETKIEEDIGTCRGFISAEDNTNASKMLRSAVGRSRRVCQVAERIVDHHNDPLFRNGLMAYVKQLQKAITGVRAAGSHVIADVTNKTAVDTLNRRFKLLIGCVTQVKVGLSDANHPDILSPLRRNTREQPKPQDNLGKRLRFQESGYVTMRSTGKLRTMGNQSVTVETGDTDVEEKLQAVRQVKVQHEKPALSAAEPTYRESGKDSSHAQSIGQELYSASSKGDKQKVNLLSGQLLGWTNHIIDSAHSVLQYCHVDKRKTNRTLCDEVDSLAPDILEKSKYVALGDVEEGAKLRILVDAWITKVEKLRIFVDVTVDRWKSVADKVCDITLTRNKDLLAIQVEGVTSHHKALCDVLSIAEDFIGERHLKDKAKVMEILQDKDDLENLTVTMATTAEMIINYATTEEQNQLEELVREWSVRMFCILGNLDLLVSGVHKQGFEGHVWPTMDSVTAGQTEVLDHIEVENSRLRDLLHSAALGDEKRSHEATELCKEMTSLQDTIKTVLASKKPASGGQGSQVIIVIYSPQRIGMLSVQWILKALKCLDLVREQITPFAVPLNSLADAVFVAKTAKTDAQRKAKMVECQEEISAFSQKLVALRQKTLQGIQLSTEIERRSSVRQCLDSITENSPQLIATVKALTGDHGSDKLYEFTRQKQMWAAKVRQLIVTLQQMSDIKKTLVREVSRLLGLETVPVTSSSVAASGVSLAQPTLQQSNQESDQTKDVDEMNGSSQNTVHPLSVLEGSLRPSGSAEDVTTSKEQDFKPAKVAFASVHEELIHATNAKQEAAAIGRFPKPRKITGASVETPSPYKPSSSILAAAKFLQREAEKWEDECNPIVQVAKEMSQQVEHMAEYRLGNGPITNHQEMVQTAKAVAENGQKMLKFAKILASHCVEERCGKDLMFYAGQIPTVSTQLSIISSVMMSASGGNADKILLENAENLMKVVMQTMKAAEAVCVKGLELPMDGTEDEVSAIILATQWRRKFLIHLHREADDADKDDLGLRRIEEHKPPTLTQIFTRN